MAKKLFVGGLSWNTSEESLREAFGKFGALADSKIITDRDTGRSRGFGFVSFVEADAAESALQQMDGAMLDGRTIRVNYAEERSSDGGRRPNRPRGGERRRW